MSPCATVADSFGVKRAGRLRRHRIRKRGNRCWSRRGCRRWRDRRGRRHGGGWCGDLGRRHRRGRDLSGRHSSRRNLGGTPAERSVLGGRWWRIRRDRLDLDRWRDLRRRRSSVLGDTRDGHHRGDEQQDDECSPDTWPAGRPHIRFACSREGALFPPLPHLFSSKEMRLSTLAGTNTDLILLAPDRNEPRPSRADVLYGDPPSGNHYPTLGDEMQGQLI